MKMENLRKRLKPEKPCTYLQSKSKVERKTRGIRRMTSWGNVKNVLFGDREKFTEKKSNYGITTIRRLHIKVANSSVSGETRM